MKNKVSLIEEYKLKYSKENTFALQKKSQAKVFLRFQKNFIQRKESLNMSRQLLTDGFRFNTN